MFFNATHQFDHPALSVEKQLHLELDEVRALQDEVRAQTKLLLEARQDLDDSWWSKAADGLLQFLSNTEDDLQVSVVKHILFLAVLMLIIILVCSPCLAKRGCNCLRSMLCGLCRLFHSSRAKPDHQVVDAEELAVLRRV